MQQHVKNVATYLSNDSSQRAWRNNTLQLIAERLVEAAGVRSGQNVLDVACGQGNAAIAAARRFTESTGVDYAANLLAQGRERAEAEHVNVTFTEGDAERLPFPAAAYDTVLSTVGVMFAPDQERASSELMRVTRKGGTIALANWTPESLVGSLFKTIGKYGPPPAGVKSPMLWGTEGSRSCSERRSGGRRSPGAPLISATTRPSISRSGSACITGPSPGWPAPSMTGLAPSSPQTSPTWPGSSTAPTTARCWHQASTWRPSACGAEHCLQIASAAGLLHSRGWRCR